MTVFSAAAAAEIARGISAPGQPNLYPVLSLDLPSGPVVYSNAGVAIAAQGGAQPRIRFGSITRSIDPRSATIASVEISPTVSDVPDPPNGPRLFSQEVARYPRSLRGIAATLTARSPRIPDADVITLFPGVLDSYDQVEPMSWQLKIRPDDFALQYGTLPKAVIDPPKFPSADPAAYGNLIPIIYGIHDSNGITAKGMVPAYKVDQAGNGSWMLGAGWLKAVRAVYGDGTVIPTSEYSIAHPIVDGILYTQVVFSAAQGDAAITADVEGLEDVGDGTGALITNPAYQLLHLLVNFGWGDWRSGPYLANATAPLLESSFDDVASFLAAKGHEGSRWIGGGEPQRVGQVLEEWLASHGVRAFWTPFGQLALTVVSDHRKSFVYGFELWLRGDEDSAAGGFKAPFPSQSLLREVNVQYVHGAVAGRYHQATRVQDLTVTDRVSRNLQLPWSAARVL